VLGFTLVEVLVFGDVMRHFCTSAGSSTDPPSFGRSSYFFSIRFATEAAAFLGHYVEGLIVWILGGFLLNGSLLMAGAESALAYEWEP
jgi:hypothetical protein